MARGDGEEKQQRTREFGTRLATGALEREVLLQFLVKAVTRPHSAG